MQEKVGAEVAWERWRSLRMAGAGRCVAKTWGKWKGLERVCGSGVELIVGADGRRGDDCNYAT